MDPTQFLPPCHSSPRVHHATPPHYLSSTITSFRIMSDQPPKSPVARFFSRSNSKRLTAETAPGPMLSLPKDAPPAYAPQDPNPASKQISKFQKKPDADPDNRYAFLENFDTIFLIDDSGSMRGSRWQEAYEAVRAISPICTKYDKDGIDIYFINKENVFQEVKDQNDVMEIFNQIQPNGGTLTGKRLSFILDPYMARYTEDPHGTKPVNIIVITDGEAQDDDQSAIVKVAEKLDKLKAPTHQVGIQFFQVGNDSRATLHLQTLDDNLKRKATVDGNLRDIVDTVPWKRGGQRLNADGILKAVLGSVNKRLDDDDLTPVHNSTSPLSTSRFNFLKFRKP